MAEAALKNRAIASLAGNIRRNAAALASVLETRREINPASFAACLRETELLAQEIEDAVGEGRDQFPQTLDDGMNNLFAAKEVADAAGCDPRSVTRHAKNSGVQKINGQYRIDFKWAVATFPLIDQHKLQRKTP
ncbi:MAG: hypothetical protein FJX45_19605 [Alphaproteobacteria bacterium]|nr:hypothetical protein [Alphaproteobacteria bacterium]MBM3654945.1 hypothetical protein [Alphaproteobacteria bacterium]